MVTCMVMIPSLGTLDRLKKQAQPDRLPNLRNRLASWMVTAADGLDDNRLEKRHVFGPKRKAALPDGKTA